MSAQPDLAHFIPAQLGPDSDDATLASWCDAATAGALPAPTLARWQAWRTSSRSTCRGTRSRTSAPLRSWRSSSI